MKNSPNSVPSKKTSGMYTYKTTNGDKPSVVQVSTKSLDDLQLSSETFSKDSINWSYALGHISIHTDGELAGGQFLLTSLSTEKPSSDDIIEFVKSLLPDTLYYDQFGRCELTLALDIDVGYTGVVDISKVNPGFVKKEMRIKGGMPDTVRGIEGAWFAEIAQDANKKWQILLNDKGEPKNPRAKFVPKSLVAYIPKDQAESVLQTNLITIIIQKHNQTGEPFAITMFPGQNAPAGPVLISTADYSVDTLDAGPAAEYWQRHCFVKVV